MNSTNMNATKPEEDRKTSFLYIRAHPEDKRKWRKAAARSEQTISTWATDALNEKAKQPMENV